MWLFFFVTQYNSSLSSFVPNFRILSKVVAEKTLTEKKSLQTDKQTMLCTKFQNPKSSSAEKSLTENFFTDRQTIIIIEKAKTIYPLYTSYRG